MTHHTAEMLLPAFVMVGLAGCIWLGYLLGSEHTVLLTRMVAARVRIIRRQRRQLARTRGERALALAQRDDAMRQLALADAALAEASHPVQHRDDLPEQDPAVDALMRAVEEPRGTHHRPEQDAPGCESLTTDPDYPGHWELYCDHPAGHEGRHAAVEAETEWDDEGETWVRGVQV